MSRTTYGNDKTGTITVVVNDVDSKDTDEPKVFAGTKTWDIPETDDNVPRTGRKRSSVTVSSFSLCMFFSVFREYKFAK